MGMLLWDFYTGRPRVHLEEHVRRLKKEGLLKDPVPDTTIRGTETWDWDLVVAIIRPLVMADAYVNTTGSLGRNPIQRTFGVLIGENSQGKGDPKAVQEVITALIKAGVDIHHRDIDGLTPSMYARRHGHWTEWCLALERNGKCITRVVTDDNTEWLLEENWRTAWKERHGSM